MPDTPGREHDGLEWDACTQRDAFTWNWCMSDMLRYNTSFTTSRDGDSAVCQHCERAVCLLQAWAVVGASGSEYSAGG